MDLHRLPRELMTILPGHRKDKKQLNDSIGFDQHRIDGIYF